MNNEFKKLVTKEFNSFAKSCGFSFRKAHMWYTVRDSIMMAIGFEFTSYKANALYCIQPLYEYSDHIVLEYGDSITRQCIVRGLDANDYLLFYDMPLSDVSTNLQNIIRFFSSFVIPVFSNIKAAGDIISVYQNKRFFFTQPVNVLRIFAYSLAFSGDYELALMYFQKYIDEFSKQNTLTSVIIKEPLYLLELLKANPNNVYGYLLQNVNRSIEALNLRIS